MTLGSFIEGLGEGDRVIVGDRSEGSWVGVGRRGVRWLLVTRVL